MQINNINLDDDFFCRQPIKSISKFSNLADRKCHKIRNHSGVCVEFPFLDDLKDNYPRVAAKIIRDSIMTTGASWKSEEAGPNRILRWVMLLSDEALLKYNIDMSKLKPQVISKLREKAADYDSCVQVAMALTFATYQMPDAPTPSPDTLSYLQRIFGPFTPNSTCCVICRLPISFNLFELAKRGKAEIETCHKDPRFHVPDNVGFAHRECNIAQGSKTLDEFYKWIKGILVRANIIS